MNIVDIILNGYIIIGVLFGTYTCYVVLLNRTLIKDNELRQQADLVIETLYVAYDPITGSIFLTIIVCIIYGLAIPCWPLEFIFGR